MMKFKHPKNLHCILHDTVFDEVYMTGVTQINVPLRGMVMDNIYPLVFQVWVQLHQGVHDQLYDNTKR